MGKDPIHCLAMWAEIQFSNWCVESLPVHKDRIVASTSTKDSKRNFKYEHTYINESKSPIEIGPQWCVAAVLVSCDLYKKWSPVTFP